MTKDPVCGASVDGKEAQATSQYQGQQYVFCGTLCKQKFDNEPQRYAKEQPRKAGG